MSQISALFSVVIATRNRPVLLARAVASVRAQQGAAYEIIIVDDGTEEPFAADLAALETSLAGTGRMLHLAPRSRGHGQGYALNTGASVAVGDYLCFLDDDDEWTDPGHLARARAIIDASPQPPDVLYFQQRARQAGGDFLAGPIWIEDLQPVLALSRQPGPHGAYPVDVATLLHSNNFCHINTTIVYSKLFSLIGGIDEQIPYEIDRDFYLRCIDRGQYVLYSPSIVAMHHVPDPTQRNNVSTSLLQREKWLSQLGVFNRAAVSANHPLIRRFGRRQRGYIKKKLAMSFTEEHRYVEALECALDGLASGFSLKWLGVTTLIGIRAGLAKCCRIARK